MKQALANTGKLIRKPTGPAAIAGSALSGGDSALREKLAARPMVRATGVRMQDAKDAQDHRRLRPRRLPEAHAPVPAVSSIVYRSGCVLMR